MTLEASMRSNLVTTGNSTPRLIWRALIGATTALTIAAAGAVPVRAAAVLVSEATDGTQGNGPSFVSYARSGGLLFDSLATNLVSGDTNALRDVFQRVGGTTVRVSTSSEGAQGNGGSFGRAMSGDGRYVLFDSFSSNLVKNDTNGQVDVFLKDVQTGQTTRVNLNSSGVVANKPSRGVAISQDGRYVLFRSAAGNLVTNDANGVTDGFLRDRQTGTTQRVTLGQSGVEGNGDSTATALSSDGRYVVFCSNATNLVSGDTNGRTDVFIRDLQLGSTERVSVSNAEGQLNAPACGNALSDDGRFVLFATEATIVGGAQFPDPVGTLDLFRRDRQAGITVAISVNNLGRTGGVVGEYSISANGVYIAFSSRSRLDGGMRDNNDVDDVYVRKSFGAYGGRTMLVSSPGGPISANGASSNAMISMSGLSIAFTSSATNLGDSDTNGQPDVYISSNPF